MGKNITVLGAGAWGTAFGQVLADAGNTVTMWAKEQQIVEGIRDHHHNAVRLPSVEKLPDNMTATGDRAEAVKNADIVVVAIAAQFARVALVEFKGLIPDHAIVVSLMKGIERGTNKRMAVGMARGAGYGENTAAMIETRGLAELTALGVAAGADPKTFFGLAGVGDLIATCGSSLSRNYTFGANLGKGLTVEEATKVSNGVAEGVPTTDAVVALGDQLDVPTPLAYQMSRVLNEGISCSEMLAGLFGHEVTGE